MKLFYKKILSMLVIFFVTFQYVPSAFASDTNGPTGNGQYGASASSNLLDTQSVTSDVYGDHSQQLGITASDTAPWKGKGTIDEPFIITTASQLDEVRHYASEHFVLGNDIKLDVPPYNTDAGWEPILWFNGTLDGDGFEITGLYINRPTEKVGLIGTIGSEAEVSNLKLVNVDVTGNYAVGGLAGWNGRGSIINSSVSGKVTGVEDESESESDSIGGLVGVNEGNISNSYAKSEVTGHYLVGGLVGDNDKNIEDSYASGTVSGVEYVGGLVGWNFSGTTINNTYANGNVTGNHLVGGLVGQNSGGISNSYAYGEVTGNSQTGGLVGSNAGTVTNSYWDIQASGQDQSAAGVGMTTIQLQQQATFVDDDWDFQEVWVMGDGASYPSLRWELNIVGPPPWVGEGKGTEKDPYMITTADQLNEVRNYLDAHFELGGDIDLGLEYGAEEGWEPIGTTSSPFIGTMDGRGYKITGLYVNRASQNDVGLFGVTGTGSEIANVRLEKIDVAGHFNIGGLVGMNEGTINNVYVSGEVTGSNFIGGLVGVNAGNITQSYARSKAEGIDFIGGLVGENDGDIDNSYAHGDVIASNDYAGGLVGSNHGGSIRYSYASGKVTGHNDVGGLVSVNLAGNVIASYWDIEATDQATSAGSSDEYGRSTVEMQQQATYADWDFDNIWAIDEDGSYPYLKSDSEGAGLPWTGTGTKEYPYMITTAAHLNQMRDHPNAHFKLGADINLDVLPYNTGEGWEPIAFFNGHLDGKGYKITGLYIDRSREDLVGLFGYTGTASKISNVKLEEVSVTEAVHDLVGGLVGYNEGSISYSSVSGKVEGYSNAGGLVGYNNGHISYSYASGEVTGSDFLGGLAGANAGNITQSYARNKVVGVDFLGGLVGVNDGNISNSYAHGDVIPSNSYVGGLVGSNKGGNISTSYASGKLKGIGYIGGLVGENLGGKVRDSYWDKETSGMETSFGSKSSYGKTTAEMEQQATFADWDFDDIWGIAEGEQYPYLKWVENANLSDLTLGEGTLSPVFTAETIHYKATVKRTVNSVNITAMLASEGASLEVNGASAISGIATEFPLRVGRNTIEVAVTAYDGVTTKTYTIDITRLSDQPSSQIINVSVETGHIDSATTVMQTPITRITESSGKVRDEVALTPDRAKETAQRIAEAGQTTARIMIPDDNDKVSQVDVNILKEAIIELVNKNVDLEIFTENVRLLIPQRSMDTFEDDLYFRVIPIKAESQQKEVENRAKSEQIVREAAKDDKVNVVSRPMTIETNMPNQPVTLILPLRDVQLPSGAAERATFLHELMIFIEHSDGEKRLVRGKIVEYKDGLLGIEFDVNKFSTFTILHMEGIAANFHEAYIRGYEDGTFRPDHTVTRAEIAAMIARNLGFDDSEEATAVLFPDVSASHWAAGAIDFVNQQGLMKGNAAGEFNPNAAITRAEMATVAARYQQFMLPTEEEGITAFTDITGHWAVLEIAANKQAGILDGYEDGTFRPNGNLTRAEAVKMMNRMFDRGPLYEVSIPTFTDVEGTHWAFFEVEEAAQDHFFTHEFGGRETIVR